MPETFPTSPQPLRRLFDRLNDQRHVLEQERQRKANRAAELAAYLDVAPKVENALQQLGDQLFGQLARTIENELSKALQEVLGQPVCLKVTQDFKRGGATLRFHLERAGEKEDIMKGTGGSVANILSVGLRILALSQLEASKHRRFLVLDEQDCWLAPDLVPKLVKIIHDAGEALGFQVLMISHHSPASFERFADRIYRFSPSEKGVEVEVEDLRPKTPDTHG
jgi:DNA repair exonuclease SbcCD ATPase subunit